MSLTLVKNETNLPIETITKLIARRELSPEALMELSLLCYLSLADSIQGESHSADNIRNKLITTYIEMTEDSIELNDYLKRKAKLTLIETEGK